MRSLLFLLGGTLIIIVLGVPADIATQSSSAKSTLPYLVFWLLTLITEWGGRYLILGIGCGLIGIAFMFPKRRSSKTRWCKQDSVQAWSTVALITRI